MTETRITTNITQAEWEVMRVVWADEPLTSREIIDRMLALHDWTESTVKTHITRLVKKEQLQKDTTHSPYLYSANISEKKANYATFSDSIERVCTKERGDLIHHLIEGNDLSQADCQALIAILTEKEKSAPAEVVCQCAPGQCHCHLHAR